MPAEKTAPHVGSDGCVGHLVGFTQSGQYIFIGSHSFLRDILEMIGQFFNKSLNVAWWQTVL